MCIGGDADYSIANIMILTEEEEGMHKASAVYGYEEMVLAMANIGIQSGGAKRGGGAVLGGYHYHSYLKKIPPSCGGGGALCRFFSTRGKIRCCEFSQSTMMF